MKLLLFCISISAFHTCPILGFTMTQSGLGEVTVSGSLSLTCAVSDSALSSGEDWWHWIRQPPGKGLVWLALIDRYGNSHYLPDIQNRATITVNPSKDEFYLRVHSLSQQDTATYYCARSTYRRFNWFDYWGQGTMVTVTSVSATAPSVFPLASCTGEVTTPQVTFGCLAKGYFPEPVTVTWSPNVGSSDVRTYPSVLHPSGDLYSLSSQVTVPASSWTSDTYRCTVQHQPTSSSSSTEIPKPIQPQVEVFYNCNNQSYVELVCLISGFYPKHVDVKWPVNVEKQTVNTEQPTKDADGHTFSTRSNLSVPQSEWKGDSPLVCQVYHPGTKTTTQAHAQKCKGLCPQG